MKKRFIAAIVLATLAVGVAPLGFAAESRQTAATAQKRTEPGSAMQDHSCCPGIHSQHLLPVVMPSPAEVPCEQHPCCAKQAPQHESALPATNTTMRRGSERVIAAFVERQCDDRDTAVAEPVGGIPLKLKFVRSTVLRI